MKSLNLLALMMLALSATGVAAQTEMAEAVDSRFVSIAGPNLIDPTGKKLFIRGTNLGNWLNPEGYMFGFQKTNSPRLINDMFCYLVGEDAAEDFWAAYRQNYITKADIDYIAACGANTIRLPFHYKLFTNDYYLGSYSDQDGFKHIDDVVGWCRDNGLYLILDMHDAPGGQTGDNIDDSYGYPWLFESERAQKKFIDIWGRIAERYADEPVILGYELINEPIAHFFENKDEINTKLEPLYKRAVAEIRKHDKKHIVLLGGPQWNSNFEPFTDWKFDDKIMYTCHRYGGDPTPEAIGNFIAFRDKTGLPMYMGELGHNTMEWQSTFVKTMEDNNIGYTFWPYKKLGDSCMMGIERPDGWDAVVAFAEGPRSSYQELRDQAPDRKACLEAMKVLLKNSRFENCKPQTDYILSIGLKP